MNKNIAHVWTPASLGGGGYITGLIQHPAISGIVYARCDVAGVFRSSDGGETWETLNGGLTKAYHHQVQSFAISPHHPEVLFRCSGEVRAGSSTDRSINLLMAGTAGGKSARVWDSMEMVPPGCTVR